MGINIRQAAAGNANTTKLVGLDPNGNLVQIEKGTYALATALVKYVLAVDGKSLLADTEITRLASLKNYDDAAIKSGLSDEVTRAKKREDELSAAINKIRIDFDSFLSDATDSDSIINRWSEVKTFLAGITESDSLTGLLLEYKNQVTGGSNQTINDLVVKFNSYVKTSDLPNFDQFIKKDGNKVLSEENYTTSDKTKLNSIESGAQKNVTPDWNATSDQAGFIANKPSIPDAYDDTELSNRVSALEKGGVGNGTAYTPVKGVDYFTQDDIDSIIESLLAASGHQGPWSSGRTYSKLVQVSHNGSTYQSQINNNTTEPGTNSDWLLIAAKGTDGINGANGIDGKDGRDGIDGKNGRDGVDGKDGENGLNGKDGLSPTLAIGSIPEGTKVTITDINGERSFNILNGKDGAPGTDGAQGAPGKDGKDGVDGTPGFSPIIELATIEHGTKVTITDEKGTKSFDIVNGTNGKDGAPGKDGIDGKDGTDGLNGSDGKDGAKGADGVSPTIEVTTTDDGSHVTITDINGEKSFDIMNGKDGADGVNGIDGKDGSDGISPTIELTEIENGTRVKITDVNGEQSFDIMNGKDGADGTQSPSEPLDTTNLATKEDLASKMDKSMFFSGTIDEYREAWAAGKIAVGAFVILTEDDTESAILGKAVIGKLVIGNKVN